MLDWSVEKRPERSLRDAAILGHDENASSSPVGVISREPSTSLIFRSQIGFFIGFVPNPTLPLVAIHAQDDRRSSRFRSSDGLGTDRYVSA